MLPDSSEAGTRDGTEWFEYPISWEEAYKATRGSRRYFAQYALMELLRQRHGIQSLTWLHLAAVDRETKNRFALGEAWVPASPRLSRTDPSRTRRRAAAWNTMRQQMGAAFETLQQAILRAQFVGAYQGEPDLFCWTAQGWFFAEAKALGERFLPSQNKWWNIARSLRGVDCQIFGCRMVAAGSRPSGQSPHTERWNRLISRMNLQNNGTLGPADDFVKRVLKK